MFPVFVILKMELEKTKGVQKQWPTLTIKRWLKGSKSGGPVQTDNGGKRFEEAMTCPNE